MTFESGFVLLLVVGAALLACGVAWALFGRG